MKYYAVTDDPRELYHYGVKGMKWGQHIFGDKPKSPGYRRAASKLRASLKANREQRAANKRAKEQAKYRKAVKAAQNRIQTIDALHNYDQDRKFAKEFERDQKRQAKIQKAQFKQYQYEKNAEVNTAIQSARDTKNASKVDKKFDKVLQQAREGKLKYGKLSPDQVQRVQDRLQMEANARRLGSAEKTWGQQKKEARRAGRLQGITKGTAAAMEEIARAGATYGIQHLLDRKKLKSKAKFEGKEERIKNRERNKKTKSDIKNDFKQEVYSLKVKEGLVRGTAKQAEVKRLIDENREMRKFNLEEKQDALRDQRKFLTQEQQNTLRNIRQEKEQQAKFEKAAEFAYLHGFVPSYLQQGGKGDKGGKGNAAEMANYYENIKKGTNEPIKEAQRRMDEAEKRAKEAEKKAKEAVNEAKRELREQAEREAAERRRKENEQMRAQFAKDFESAEDESARDISGMRPQHKAKRPMTSVPDFYQPVNYDNPNSKPKRKKRP